MELTKGNELLRKINNFYQKQLEIYKRILDLTNILFDNCHKGDMQDQEVLNLVNERLKLMGSIDEINVNVNKLKKEAILALNIKDFNLSSIRGKVVNQLVDELAELLKELGSVLYTINKLDDNIKNLYNTNQETRNKFKQINKQTAQASYKKFMPQDK